MASPCTEQAVQEFLLEKGGRVQQMELIDHFTSLCGFDEQSNEEVDRDVLKRIVDSVGFVKVENGVKFVCLKTEGSVESVMRSDADSHDHAECNGNVQDTLDNKHVYGNPENGDQTARDQHWDSYHSWRRGGETEGQEEARVGSNYWDARSGPGPLCWVPKPVSERSTQGVQRIPADCASVTLDPLEHEWMLCASDGLWESLQPLLAVEPSLVAKKDFVTGFTCLHWAAKQGKAELLSQLLSFAKENTIPVNVNVRSSAGYTPLHLAAMHGHTQVVRVLLSDWEADPETRDYSGRRAIQYLAPPLAADLQKEGAATSPGPGSDTDYANSGGGIRGWRLPKVLQGNLNPLRLLNSPAETSNESAGTEKTKGGLQRKTSLSRLNVRLHRGRHRAQIIHSASFRDTGEVGREELPRSPLRTRPLSNLFG
uniref:Sosondowah ankyrin repeat domain family member C n=1 Tax=Nothobranchius furzeri TaxID=105023 RepID=A0A8C6Q8D1_NOTFU